MTRAMWASDPGVQWKALCACLPSVCLSDGCRAAQEMLWESWEINIRQDRGSGMGAVGWQALLLQGLYVCSPSTLEP